MTKTVICKREYEDPEGPGSKVIRKTTNTSETIFKDPSSTMTVRIPVPKPTVTKVNRSIKPMRKRIKCAKKIFKHKCDHPLFIAKQQKVTGIHKGREVEILNIKKRVVDYLYQVTMFLDEELNHKELSHVYRYIP